MASKNLQDSRTHLCSVTQVIIWFFFFWENAKPLMIKLFDSVAQEVKKTSSLFEFIAFAIFALDKLINLFEIQPCEWDSEWGLPKTLVKNGFISL